MAEEKKAYYEGMFLFGQAATADLGQVVEHIKEVLGRGDAEIVAMKKWDERRLAYEIKKHKRGLYILAYFKVAADALPKIERSCNLSEMIVRFMIIRADHLTLEEMQAADGQQELADEAAMRKEQGESGDEGREPATAASSESTEG